ncbi:MAG: N-acetyl-alpha-D-glucosaminyl L-malate synthase BshA [Deltaproteobacteria bacterium]|nr:N-acetyl-alpha-D-glucosaminyl L-malate synthase BshA [Deltaproteobacteria bacterium]
MASERRLRIGIACYPTFGGSGVIATEIGLEMARRGHEVHVFAYEKPARLEGVSDRQELGAGILFFHRVEVRDYPVFHQPPYALAMASRIVDVAAHGGLDLLHVHYAVPHATSAYLAREVLRETLGARAPKIITTLHGTDITLVGSDPSYRPITRFSILKSDAVTVPSEYLAAETRARFDVGDMAIAVLPNFVDTDRFRPREASADVPSSRAAGVPRFVHVSNLRPVKRLGDVLAIFAGVRREVACELVVVGDGPDRVGGETWVREHGVQGVSFLGHHLEVADVLRETDVFLLPSELESFGVAALEAMAVGLPVLASAVGGLPEVVEHGRSGFLAPVGDVEAFVKRGIALVTQPELARAMGARGREIAVERFALGPAVDRYETLYRSLAPFSP